MKNRNYIIVVHWLKEVVFRTIEEGVFDIALFRSIRPDSLYPKRENSQQAWKWLVKSLQCILWQTVSGRLSVGSSLVGVSIGSAHKCFRGMNEQDTPGTISSRSTSKRERKRERENQGMPTWSRVPSRCRTFLHSARIIAREDERGSDRFIVCFFDFADFKCKLRINEAEGRHITRDEISFIEQNFEKKRMEYLWKIDK